MSDGFFQTRRRRSTKRPRAVRQRLLRDGAARPDSPPRRRRALRWGVLFVFAAAGTGGGWFLTPPAVVALFAFARGEHFSLRSVEILDHSHVSAASIVSSTALTPGIPLLDIDVEQVEAHLRSHPWIQEARALRLPPSHLVVSVQERTPEAVAAAAGTNAWYLVDAEGTPFAPAQPKHLKQLPRIHTSTPLAAGETQPDLARALELVRELAAAELPPVAEIRSAPTPEGFAFRLGGSRTWVVLGNDDWPAKLERFERARRSGHAAVDQAAAIDLRFDNQVVLRGEQDTNTQDAFRSAAASERDVRPPNRNAEAARGGDRRKTGEKTWHAKTS